MQILFILIAFSLSLALIFLGGFYWAVKSKQYEDAYSPSVRMLFDDINNASDTFSNNSTETKHEEA